MSPAVATRPRSAAARRAAALDLARRLPIDQDQLRAVVAGLGAIGSRPDGFRVTGTPEDRAAAELVAGHLRAAGLRDVALEAVTVDGWRLGEATLTLHDGAPGAAGDGTRREGAPGSSVIRGASLGGAPGTPAGGIRAELVDVRTGHRRRLDRMDLSGRMCLLDWHTLTVDPADVALELGSRGAAGVVLASFAGGPLYQAADAIGSFDGHWHAGAPPVLTIAKEDAARLRAAAPLEATLVVDAELAPGTDGCNSVGWLDGAQDGPPIVVGAHHDGWFRAAFDNATGVAVLVALAGGLTQLGHVPRHPIVFTSRTAEEYGTADCHYDWCAGVWGQIDRTHPEWAASPFHLVLEASGHPGLRTIVEAPVELTRWARAACRTADAEGWLTAGWRVGPPVTGTEQWPYLVKGVPGLATYAWESSFRRDRYHTPADTLELVDLDHLERVIRTYALLLLEADADPDAIHDHGARARHLAKTTDDDTLTAAAGRHGERKGRAAFSVSGTALHAVDAHGAIAYPHAQATRDAEHLTTALAALDAGEADARDHAAAAKALAKVGANHLTRVLSADVFARHEARRGPDGERLAWAAASHLTASPDLHAELASLRGEPGARPAGPWLKTSIAEHLRATRAEQHRRTAAMTLALEHP